MSATNDTIAAIATAPGASGLAVVRLSGTEALALADRVFRGRAPLMAAPSHTLHLGWIAGAAGGDHSSNGRGSPRLHGECPARPARVDQVVAAVFRAPRSYTRENVIEFSCHGGRLSAERVLDAVLAAGARLAAPGEFTLRAFLSGRIDLAQAEAVADVIHAETEAAHAIALQQLAGELSRRLAALSEELADAIAEVEARVDFAEDVGGIEVPAHVVAAFRGIAGRLERLLAGAPYARAIREGVRLPLVGRPNVGKSSLFNALLGEERAIVAPEPGTTRDRVSEAVEIGGVRFTLSDTAGLRPAGGAVEAIGIERSRSALEESRIVLWVLDGARPLGDEDRDIAELLAGKRVLAALNKQDLPAAFESRDLDRLLSRAERSAVVRVSAVRGAGLDAARSELLALLDAAAGDLETALANPRHVEALTRAHRALARAADAGEAGEPGEIVALELREAAGAIGEVSGKVVTDADLLDRIFSRFCVGK